MSLEGAPDLRAVTELRNARLKVPATAAPRRAFDRHHHELQMEIVSDASVFAGLRDEWNALLSSSKSDCIFLTWEWLFSWWKHLSAGRALSLLTVRSGRELVAIVPFCVNTQTLFGFVLGRTLEFLGTGTVSSDHLDLIIKPGREEEVIDAVADHLVERQLVVKFVHYDRGSSFTSQLAENLQRRGWVASETTLVRSRFIKVRGHTWDSYLATLDGGYRHQLRRRMRKLNKDFNVSIDEVRNEQSRAAALRQLFALHELRWRDRGGSKALHTPELRAFHDEVSRMALERGWLRLMVQSLDGAPAAARYGFRYGLTYYSYQSGFDPAYASHWIGVLSLASVIKSSIEEGCEEHDLLAGDEEYKSRLAAAARDLGRLEVYPRGARWVLYRRARNLYRTLANAVNSTSE
jgi:CelD/BcsL family acetyltransferase involved in cellulose biosynthesis